MQGKYLSRSWRSRKIYGTVLRILWSYLWAWLLSKLFGRKYWEKRVASLHLRNANRLKNTLLELKGLFIKIGQLVSILSSFLPEEFRQPLQEFQDKAPARPFDEIRSRILSELGAEPEELFQSFEPQPLASASIGQVHRAILHDGRLVAVKIQHAHVPQIASIDLDLFDRVLRLHAFFMDFRGLEFVSRQVRQMIEDELDYEREAANMALMKDSLKDLPHVIIPELIPQFSTKYIITSTFCEGTKINDLATIKNWGLDSQEIAKKLIELCCKMVLIDGIYHADPHPGNVHLDKKGNIILFDFGAISHVPPKMKSELPKLIEGAAKGDTEQIIESMSAMGFVSKNKDALRFAEKILDAGQDFLKNELQLDGLNFQEVSFDPDAESFRKLLALISIRDITNTFQVPKDYILLNRMLVLASGISAELAPQLNPLEVIRPFIKNMVLKDGKPFATFVLDAIKSNLSTLLTLPGEAQKVLQKAKRGELEIRLKDLDTQLEIFYFLGQQFMWVLLIIVAGVLAYNSYLDGFMQLYQMAIGASLVFLFLFLRSIWHVRRHRRRL